MARDHFSGWVEARPLVLLRDSAAADFLVNGWIYCYGAIKKVSVDGGGDFKKELVEAVKMSGEALGKAKEYYPQGAGMVEQGHQLLKNGLVKMCGEDGTEGLIRRQDTVGCRSKRVEDLDVVQALYERVVRRRRGRRRRQGRRHGDDGESHGEG